MIEIITESPVSPIDIIYLNIQKRIKYIIFKIIIKAPEPGVIIQLPHDSLAEDVNAPETDFFKKSAPRSKLFFAFL